MSEYRLTPRGRALVNALGAVVTASFVVLFLMMLTYSVAAYLGLLP